MTKQSKNEATLGSFLFGLMVLLLIASPFFEEGRAMWLLIGKGFGAIYG